MESRKTRAGSVRRARRELYARLAAAYRGWAMRRNRQDPASVVQRARTLVRRKRYCLVVTADPQPAARVVEPFPPDEHGRIVFGTDPDSRKVAQIRSTGRCLLVYQDDRRRACVTLECDAEVLSPEQSTRFRAIWRAFWPEGPGRDFVNVVCTPTAVELWDGLGVVAPEPFGRAQARVPLGPELKL